MHDIRWCSRTSIQLDFSTSTAVATGTIILLDWGVVGANAELGTRTPRAFIDQPKFPYGNSAVAYFIANRFNGSGRTIDARGFMGAMFYLDSITGAGSPNVDIYAASG
jgi:hypothetical protein